MEQEMYYGMLTARPCADNPEAAECDGAYVNCFVRAEDPAEAKERAKALLAAEGWELTEVRTLRRAQRERYAQDPEMSRCYDEALEYGESAVIYAWEKEE